MESSEVDSFLTHHGIKGMKWGIRRKNPTADSSGSESKDGPKEVTVKSVPGKGIKGTEGGQKHPVHEDAARAAAVRQLAKTSTTDSVSSKDLQAAISRMKLEDSYKVAIRARNAKGPKAFLLKFLYSEAKSKASGQETPTAKAVKAALAYNAAKKTVQYAGKHAKK